MLQPTSLIWWWSACHSETEGCTAWMVNRLLGLKWQGIISKEERLPFKGWVTEMRWCSYWSLTSWYTPSAARLGERIKAAAAGKIWQVQEGLAALKSTEFQPVMGEQRWGPRICSWKLSLDREGNPCAQFRHQIAVATSWQYISFESSRQHYVAYIKKRHLWSSIDMLGPRKWVFITWPTDWIKHWTFRDAILRSFGGGGG